MKETNNSKEKYDFELIPLGYKDEFGDDAFKVVDKEESISTELDTNTEEADKEYFQSKLKAIKIAKRFASEEEKVYFSELEKAIKISLKYL